MKPFWKILLLPALCLLSGRLCAQELSGTVRNTQDEAVAGAAVLWLGQQHGAVTDAGGRFSIPHSGKMLVVSCLGYASDTIAVDADSRHIDIILREGIRIEAIDVKPASGTFKSYDNIVNTDVITRFELGRAACCNLGESFSTNPSVDVNYADAATGASQIKLLGLSGTYVQMLNESVPQMRGAAMPYSLGYIPGPWMQSIQISKGASSVKNGFESLTGQINVEFKKPQSRQGVSANLFMNSELRHEANADAEIAVSPRWSTGLLLHYDNSPKAHDQNGDTFADMPLSTQYNIANRWAYIGDRYIFQAWLRALDENRRAGQLHPGISNPYTIGIHARRYEAWAKNAFILDAESQRNVALIASASIHDMDSRYGKENYDVLQDNLYASLLYESQYGRRHFLSAGLSTVYDLYRQNCSSVAGIPYRDSELTPGAYAQYTYMTGEIFMFMLGLREDYSSRYGFFTTPRANVRIQPLPFVAIRASAGMGYRTPRPLAENSNLLASGRKVVIDPDLQQEQAWNYGASILFTIPISQRDFTFSLEYYRTDFVRQTVMDMDSDPFEVHFSNLHGRSFSDTFQAEIGYQIVRGLSATAALRASDVRTTIAGRLVEKPLTSRYKGLVSLSYATPLEKWQFDATLQLNGGGRMPQPYIKDSDGSLSWPERYGSFVQLSAQVKRNFRYWSIYIGAENLTNFKQANPIIGAANPWQQGFDGSMIWGPTTGRMVYIGLDFNWNKY